MRHKPALKEPSKGSKSQPLPPAIEHHEAILVNLNSSPAAIVTVCLVVDGLIVLWAPPRVLDCRQDGRKVHVQRSFGLLVDMVAGYVGESVD